MMKFRQVSRHHTRNEHLPKSQKPTKPMKEGQPQNNEDLQKNLMVLPKNLMFLPRTSQGLQGTPKVLIESQAIFISKSSFQNLILLQIGFLVLQVLNQQVSIQKKASGSPRQSPSRPNQSNHAQRKFPRARLSQILDGLILA